MSDRIEELKNEIKEIEKAQGELASKKHNRQTELAALLCPFKVGDVGTLRGYSYKGSRAKIVTVALRYGHWVCAATVYKSDGTLGSRTTDFSKESDFELEKT